MYFWSTLLAGSALAITFINGRALVGSVVGTSLLLIGATFIPRRIRESRRVRRLASARSEGVPETSVGTKPV
jgi:hypothetical protein